MNKGDFGISGGIEKPFGFSSPTGINGKRFFTFKYLQKTNQ
jgi:hypothetical protein